jgi:hypothetical protein
MTKIKKGPQVFCDMVAKFDCVAINNGFWHFGEDSVPLVDNPMKIFEYKAQDRMLDFSEHNMNVVVLAVLVNHAV